MQTTAPATAPRSADRRILFLAVILGAIAAGLIVAYLQSLSSVGESGPPTLSVVVARQDIPAGTKIAEGMVEVKALPEAAVLPGALPTKDQVVGQTARYPIARGEQISNLRLVEPPKVPAISFQIPPGLRGFTSPVQVQRSPAALLVPGDFVDVLVSVELRTLGLPTPAG